MKVKMLLQFSFRYGKVYRMRPAVHIAAIIKLVIENNLNISDFKKKEVCHSLKVYYVELN